MISPNGRHGHRHVMNIYQTSQVQSVAAFARVVRSTLTAEAYKNRLAMIYRQHIHEDPKFSPSSGAPFPISETEAFTPQVWNIIIEHLRQKCFVVVLDSVCCHGNDRSIQGWLEMWTEEAIVQCV